MKEDCPLALRHLLRYVSHYRFPRCHTQTYSLTCCRAHKEGSGNNGARCKGKRNRPEFCLLENFANTWLASDYHFLEEMLKVLEESKWLYQGIILGGGSAASLAGAVVKQARGGNIIPAK